LEEIQLAFVDRSFDYLNNYEMFEAYGDPIVNALTSERISIEFPQLRESQDISNMLAYYKSNSYFTSCVRSTIPDIDSLIRKRGIVVGEKIYADIFEAFFFAIQRAVNRIKFPMGKIVVENLYTKFTAQHPMSLDPVRGNPKSIVYEIFDENAISENPPVKAIYDPKAGITVTLKPESVRSILKMLGSTAAYIERVTSLKDNFVSQGKANDRQMATFEAYTNLLNKLKNIGITPKTYEEAKSKNEQQKYEEDRLERQKRGNPTAPRISLTTAMAQHGDAELYFTKQKSGEGTKIWDLVARKDAENGALRLVGSRESSSDPSKFYLAKYELFDLYANEK